MTSDHTFFGTWVISECSLDGVAETTGLEGIKFRLDESGDIIWYNDLINTTGSAAPTTTTSSTDRASSGSGILVGSLDEYSRKFINYGQQQGTMDTSDLLMQNESAEALFACETFEVIDLTSNGPGLIFGAYAGHNIEFKTNTYLPGETMTLICDGWYQVICKRVRDSQSIGQEAPFSLIEAFHEGYFTDVSIKCMDGEQFNLHSSILRINGFDSSMNYQQTLNVIGQYEGGGSGGSAPPSAALPSSPSLTSDTLSCKADVKLNAPSPRHFRNYEIPRFFPSQISSNYLIPPSVDVFNFSPRTVSTISSSFNCLTSAVGAVNFHREFSDHFLDIPKRYPTSCSDSNLTSKEIFNFNSTANSQPAPTITTDFPLSPTNSTCRNKIKPPLSPFRARSPSPFPSSLDTPPSSPLTPISVLQNLPSAILAPIIHWFYAECLPLNLEEDICSKLINFGETTPPLNKMIEPCRKYLKNIKLRKFTIDVIMEIHSCLNKMIQSVNPSTISHSPTVLCDAFKQGIREASVGCAKILQFCNIFVKNTTNITRYQRHELIKYIRSRLPIFMSQIHQLLQNILGVLSSLNIDERTDLIIYLVPEIDLSLDIITNLINNIKLSLEKMCKTLKKINKYDMQQQQQHQQTTAAGNVNAGGSPKRYPNSDNDLKFILYMYEVKKMRDIYGRISSALEIIQHKKTTFNDMNLSNKQRTIRRNMEQLIIEMPSYIFRLEEISDSLDDKIGWKEFKFCFKLATSQINGVISKLLDHKPALNDPINQICNLVQRESFTKAMIDLELIDKNVLNQNDCLTTEMLNNDKNNPVDYDNVKLNLVRNFCESPTAAQSSLSKNALRLLHSVQLYDLEFEVIITTTNPFRYKQPTDLNNQNNNDNIIINDIDNDVDTNQVHVFKAHRVIIAARCEWFKKALLSGMQEDINRKITIYDTSPVIFRRLLLYLYGAPVDKTVGVEQLCELMLLADRYSVDELKEICETTLIGSIDEDSVICLFGIADRFNAINLKTNCLSFMSQHTYLTQTDIFLELPILLQNEVQDLIQWCDRIPEPWGLDHNSLTHHYHTHHNYSNRRSSYDKQSHQQQSTAAAATGIFGNNSSSGSGLGLNVNVNVNSGRRGLKSPSRTTSRSRSRRSSPSFM